MRKIPTIYDCVLPGPVKTRTVSIFFFDNGNVLFAYPTYTRTRLYIDSTNHSARVVKLFVEAQPSGEAFLVCTLETRNRALLFSPATTNLHPGSHETLHVLRECRNSGPDEAQMSTFEQSNSPWT